MTSLDRRTFLTATGALTAVAALPLPALAAATPLDLTITHYPEQDYAMPVVVAQELGYFAKEGLEARSIVGSSGGGTTVRNVINGGLALGEVSTSAAIKAILAGEELRIVGSGVHSPGTICWAVKKDSPIKSIKDLVGKTVGFSTPGSVSETLLQMSLKAAGIDPTTVKTKAAGGIGENQTLLEAGGLDAAFTVDPITTQRKDVLRVIFFAREYVPRYLQTVWVASTSVIRTNRSEVAGLLRARKRGVEYVVAKPKESAAIFARVAKQKVDVVTSTLANEHPAEYFADGSLEGKALALVVDGMRIGRLLGADKIPLAKMVDQSALAPANRNPIPETA
ncbi:MAG: ABC transporter substrate-binding protein [Candidatus Elarobacter sp.]